MSTTTTPESCDVLVVGAGPVGLFTAVCAARRGLDVLVLDQTWRGYEKGHATVLHPSSLALLEEGGLADRLREKGRSIERVALRIDDARVESINLTAPALAVPQTVLEGVLLAELRNLSVEVRAPHQATTIEQHPEHVDVRVIRRELVTLGSPANYSTWEPVESSVLRVRFVVGADGYASGVRRAIGIDVASLGSTESFAMFECPGGEPGTEATLCYHEGLGSLVLPLPDGRTRWGFQLAEGLDVEADLPRLCALIAERAPLFAEPPERVDWSTVIQFERRLARRFGKGRVWLAGDAAHVTSPFGGHSMNVGLSEAGDLAWRIAECLHARQGPVALELYEAERERDWHKLLGINVRFELLPHAPRWLSEHARRLVPALPASGADLAMLLERLGLRLV